MGCGYDYFWHQLLDTLYVDQWLSVSLTPITTSQKPVLMNVLNEASALKNILLLSVTDHFELCLAKCRTRDELYRNRSFPEN